MPLALIAGLRWLLLVVTIAGSIPVRICTCGASLHLHGSPFRWGWGSTQAGWARTDASVAHRQIILTANLLPLEQHDPDCHLLRPRPLMGPSVLPAGADQLDDAATTLVLLPFCLEAPSLTADPLFLRLPHPPPEFSSIALHLALCQLRN